MRRFGELPDEQVLAVAEAWEKRIGDDTAVLALMNEGRLAGASLPHSHSQLVWVEIPSEALERLPDLIETYELERRGGVVSAVHPVGASPYECLIASVDAGGELADGLVLLRDLVHRFHDTVGVRPWNAWLHPGPSWHLHFVPRLTALAGIELGAEIYVNVVQPDRAAEQLRATS